MIQRTRLACRLSKPRNCLGLDRGFHPGQRTLSRVDRPHTCSQSIRPSEFSTNLLLRGAVHTCTPGPKRGVAVVLAASVLRSFSLARVRKNPSSGKVRHDIRDEEFSG